MRQKAPRGFVIYRGPSAITGDQIVAVALLESGNRKTGNMVQTYILRSNLSPLDTVRFGADDCICGDCPHRGLTKNGKGRPCYVVIAQGPTVVYKSLRAGKYPIASPEYVSELIAGRPVRLGTYGDPAAVPADVWQALVAHAGKRTGYTHQWKTCDTAFAGLCMASCDSASDYATAKAAGYRTFRVRAASEAQLPSEIVCPASDEGGHKVNCDRCGLCNGSRRGNVRDVVIKAHGTGRKFFALTPVE